MVNILSFLNSNAEARAEKRRLEAFFSGLPLEYCGWNASGALVFSRGFTRLLNIDRLNSIHDIENALKPSDAAALEGCFLALTKQGEGFAITTHTLNNKILKISGTRGVDLNRQDSYDILWLQDITPLALETDDLKGDLQSAKDDAEQLRQILDSIPMPIWISNALSSVAWINNAYQTIIGKPKAEITDKKLFLPVTLIGSNEDASKKIESLIQETRTKKTQNTIRARLIIEGQRRVVEFTFLPVENSDIVITQTCDVTQEEDRAAEHKRYVAAQSKLLEQLHTAIAIFAADHRLEFYNSAFSKLWNIEDAYLNDHPKLGDLMEKLRELRRLPEQADFRTFKKSWLDMFTGLLQPHEEMMYLPSGNAIRWLAAPHPMGGLMMTFEDVTSRLALETSYNTLMAMQRETLENLAEGVSVFGSDGRLKYYNPRFAKLWNLNPEELEGEPHVSEVVEKTKKFFRLGWKDVEEVLTQLGIDRREQMQQLNRDDDTVLECISVPMPDGGVMVTYRDITDKMRAEIALREKALALEEAEKLKLDFLANVSYQLRTPLGTMTGFAEILKNRYFGELNAKQDEYTNGILEAGERLMILIDDILDLSTIEAGYLSLKLEPVDIKQLLQEVFDLTHEWAGRENLQTTLDCPKNIGTIRADNRRMKQILVNLMRNAISFTPRGGTITITAKAMADAVTITIKDTGIGIHPDDIQKVFAPFKRSATTTALGKATGPGLGLSLVRNITELHGGNVELESTLGQGTAITLTLPREGPKN